MAFRPLRTALLLAAITSHSTSLVAAQSNPRPSPGSDSDNTNPRGSYEACPQVPSLHCKNGSTCESGVAAFGKQHDHLGLQTHESGYYCKCLPGFIGHECSIQVDDCDGDTGYNPSDPTGVLQSCYHGSECKTRSKEMGGSGEFYCDCQMLNKFSGPTATKFAGMMCQHESTGLCAASLVGESAPNHQFCTNHGKCVKMVAAGDPHPGCVCRNGWMGDHCEIRETPLLDLKPLEGDGGGNPVAGKILFSLMIIAMGSVIVGIAVILVKAKKRIENSGGSAEVVVEDKKTVVGAGDLDADGSGTLGSGTTASNSDGVDADGDMELTLKVEDGAPADSEEPEIV